MRIDIKASLLPLLFAAALAFAPACGGADSEGSTGGGSPDASEGDAAGGGGDVGATGDDSAADGATEPIDEDAGPIDDGATVEVPEGDACINPDDLFVADMALDLLLEQCAPPCLDADDAGACIQGCADQAGFSDACAECFGGLGACVVAQCGGVCTSDGEGDEACGPCLQAMCSGAFTDCSGLDLFGDEPPEPDPTEGLCTNPEDEALAEAGADAACFDLCISQADPASCMDACFGEAGFSEACSECGGKVMGCVAENCPEACTEETTSADDGAACGICVTQTCGAEFAECFSNAGETDPDVGDCVNPVDVPLLDAGANNLCDTLCITDPEPGECTVDCYEEAGFTEACSECAGELIGCLDDNCPGACTDEGFAADEGEACLGCLFDTCGEQFGACYDDPGLEPEPGPELGICQMGDDGELLASDEDPSGQCWVQCMTQADAETCMVECLDAEGFSDACAGCAGAFAGCIAENCPDACTPEAQAADQGQACGECIGIVCAEEWTVCFAAPEDAPAGAGQCTGSEDAALFADTAEETNPCVYVDCWDEADPQSCAEICYDDAGFSGGCANCLGELAGCLAGNCSDACAWEAQVTDGGAACGQCMFTSCAEEFDSCFTGAAPQPEPDPGICLLDDQDIEAISAPGDAIGYCFGLCQSGEDGCMADCMMEAGFTVACSECAGEFTSCIIDNCAAECSPESQADDGGEACGACMGPACGPLWPKCFAGIEEVQEGTGLCVNPSDSAIDDSTGGNGFGACWGECMDDPDTEACVSDCMTTVGYSGDCSECMGAFADCIGHYCGDVCTAEAQAVDGGEACGLCIGPACGMKHADCYAGAEEAEPPPEPPPGLCVDNAQDIAAVAAPGDAIGYCLWFNCLGSDDDDCMNDCMLSSGFTDPCANCAGTFVNCVNEGCGDVCNPETQADDEGEACGECMGLECGPLWPACFQGIDEVEEEPGLCVNPADQALDDAADDGGFGDCWNLCVIEPDTDACVVECMVDAGYSADCSDCVGTFAGCILDNCAAECSPEGQAADGGVACGACMGPACTIESAACYAGSDEEEPEPTDEAACAGPEDTALLDSEDNLAWGCGWGCLEDDEPATCMFDCTMDAGFSGGCAFCFGFAGECLANNCATECSEASQMADGGEACDGCITGACSDIWTECFPPDDEP